MSAVESALLPVQGIRLSATATNMRYIGRDDLVLMELCPTSKGVGAFTCNRFKGAPIVVASSHLAKSEPRYLLINAGSANAGLGERGVRDAVLSCRMLAQAVGKTDVEKILPLFHRRDRATPAGRTDSCKVSSIVEGAGGRFGVLAESCRCYFDDRYATESG